jgi:arginyl-tRNA synthetase
MSNLHIYTILQNAVAQAAEELFSATLAPSDVQVQETRKEFEGDFTVVVFPLTRISRKSPQETADLLGHYLVQQLSEVEQFAVVKGFLNLSLTDSFWTGYLQAQALSGFKWKQAEEAKVMMIEYSSPNTNKPLHLGHIRNNLLGYSMSELLKARGHRVIKVNLINDRGIHICKSMLAWKMFGKGETPQSSGMKGDHLVGKYYVAFDKAYKVQVQTLVSAGASKENAEKQAPLMQEAQEMLRNWEAGDPETIRVWEMMNGWVYAGFDETYKNLGVAFDKFYYESQTYLLGKDIVREGLKEGVFYKKDDGSVWVDLTADGLDEKLLLRSDGTSVYITQDLGTASERFDEFHLSQMIYVVGNEQEYHFKVLRLIFKKLGRPWYDSLYHLSYGMVELPSGKMKSREGTVVDADDLIDEMLQTAEERTRSLGKIDELEEQEQKDLFRKIGLAALKFYILKADPKKGMLFNPEESIDFQGFTGPFIQYTYARICSIARKAGVDAAPGFDINLDYKLKPEERELLQLIYRHDAVLESAEKEYSPALLANYAYELAKSYNKFYHEHQVLNEPDAGARAFRLTLTLCVGDCIRETTRLLGIEMPERM